MLRRSLVQCLLLKSKLIFTIRGPAATRGKANQAARGAAVALSGGDQALGDETGRGDCECYCDVKLIDLLNRVQCAVTFITDSSAPPK